MVLHKVEECELKEIIDLYKLVKDLPDLQLKLKIKEDEQELTKEINLSDENYLYLTKINERLEEINEEINKFEFINSPLKKETILYFKELKEKNFITKIEFNKKINEFIKNSINSFSIRNLNEKEIDLQICLVIKKDLIKIWENIIEYENQLKEKLEINLKKIIFLKNIFEDENQFYLLGDSRNDEIEICKNLKNVKENYTFFKEENYLNSFIANYFKEIIRKEFCLNKITIEEVNNFQNKWFKETNFFVNNLNEWAITSFVRQFLNKFKSRGILIRKTINKIKIKQISKEINDLIKIFEKISNLKTERINKINEIKEKTLNKQFTNLEEINSEKFIIYLTDIDFLFLKSEINEKIAFKFQENLKNYYKNYLKDSCILIKDELTTVENIKDEFNELTKLINEINLDSIGIELYFYCLVEIFIETEVDFNYKFYIYISNYCLKLFNKFSNSISYKRLNEFIDLLNYKTFNIKINFNENDFHFLTLEEIKKISKKFFIN